MHDSVVSVSSQSEGLIGRRLTLKRIKIGAKEVRCSKYLTCRMAERAAPRELFAAILDRIQRFGMPAPLLQRA